ncbi:MAG: flagellum-specific ATP synthase FliI, partial [Polaromonas sp.]
MTDKPGTVAANPHLAAWQAALGDARTAVSQGVPVRTYGRLTRAVGLVLEAVGLRLPVGSDCLIELPPGYPQKTAEAEVVGFAGDRILLMPLSAVDGLLPGARVYALESPAGAGGVGPRTKRLPVGDGMLGRVVDAAGRP